MVGKRAVFRADASAKIGGGHIMRCLTLAGALRDAGLLCLFWTTEETLEIVPALARSGHDIIHAAPSGKADLLVVDHYGLEAAFEKSCRSWAGKIMALDDLANRDHDCDILLDQAFGRTENDYRPHVPLHCRLLVGPRYVLLRPRFPALREASLARRAAMNGEIRRILVFCGTMNLHNLTDKILEALDTPALEPFDVDVVMGGGALFLDKIRERVAAHTYHRIVLQTDVEDMAGLMAEADLVIGAGGGTSWERFCLGLPSIVMTLADNQVDAARALEKAGAVVYLGDHAGVSPRDIRKALQDLVESPQKVASLSRAASGIVDPHGVQAVLSCIGQVLEG